MRMVLLAAIAAVVFEVFVLVFAASADRSAVRALPKWVWIFICVIFPVLGGIAYLIYGRPIVGEAGFESSKGQNRGKSGKGSGDGGGKSSEVRPLASFLRDFFGIDEEPGPNVPAQFKYRPEPSAKKGPVAPDDDPEFLRELDRKLKKQKKDSAEPQKPSGNDAGGSGGAAGDGDDGGENSSGLNPSGDNQ